MALGNHYNTASITRYGAGGGSAEISRKDPSIPVTLFKEAGSYVMYFSKAFIKRS